MPRIGRTSEAVDGEEDPGADSPPPQAAEGHEPGAGETPTERTEVITPDEQWAGHLRGTIPSLFMCVSMIKPFGEISQGAYKLFRDQLLADCNNPTDPIEIMDIEQLALSHFNMGLLQCRAAKATTVEATSVYSSAASRLMAEFRRSVLALQAYRAASRQLAHDPAKDFVIPVTPAVSIDDQTHPACRSVEQDRLARLDRVGQVDRALGDHPLEYHIRRREGAPRSTARSGSGRAA